MSIITGFNSQKYSDFDPRNYASIGADGSLTTSGISVKTTILDVSGEGFIELATLANVSGANRTLTITIDGTAKTFNLTTGAAAIGFFESGKYENTQVSSTSTLLTGNVIRCGSFYAFSATPQVPYTIADTSFAGMAFSTVPIFFNTSLKIQAESTTASLALTYSIRGGLLT